MYEILLVIYLVAALGVIGLVMVQQGKGADMGASFGAGASGTLFGSSGSGNFLTRMTTLCALIFFVISLVLGNISTKQAAGTSGWDNLSAPATTQTVEQPKTAITTDKVVAAEKTTENTAETTPATSEKSQ
ncbi:preprotein translocase subunit SecG [Photobacterium phosphoreum]|jgi:preprotein translocase subunit SecG|uniref:Protein-export membrane protein SecG n=1 Tax=Photobacterium phosphoreum TaxID=659 RepID=A0A2T3JSV8_PHOPO|nr:preprotein translocase subunit SecG [Photobacterium phosphoreum]MCD9463961.1 preprotein translocase subunit SecG [Photobacterium phosphoreum]MCD9471279.1 preprotein translocase subunit SecG [Photobacterium phosphoreum]MCD9474956.1 preprotein translocase subunit SecG [Photobacterium phosphoreum]MCD9479430.1 preprotein translocase subunit SecG [Photobacterium phosphoreum]MCD9484008.1 preprotein translocase subunit SecG [Photobacterium phosphoreum]